MRRSLIDHHREEDGQATRTCEEPGDGRDIRMHVSALLR